MKIDTEWMHRWFVQFNADYFDNALPLPRLELSKSRTRLGSFSCRGRRRLLHTELTDFCIRLSIYYDQSERDYQNTLLHEMIHYHIAYTRQRDTSAHGMLFRRMMARLNRDYGWDVRVTSLAPDTLSEPITTPRLLLAAEMTDGLHLLSIVNPRYARQLDDRVSHLNEIKTHQWFSTVNPHFAHFPQVRSMRFRIVTAADYARYTSDATPVTL